MFNLTMAKRVSCMEHHFELISKVMKDQIKISEFDDYALPVDEDVV